MCQFFNRFSNILHILGLAAQNACCGKIWALNKAGHDLAREFSCSVTGDSVMSFDIVRREDIPQYLMDRFENWGRWSRSTGGHGSAGGLEGKFRHNRCPDCYELAGPCDVCKRSAASSSPSVDMADGEVLEAAWVAMGVGRVEKQLLRGYFVFRQSPKALIARYGIRRDAFWYLLLRGAKEAEQHARIITCRRKSAMALSAGQSSDLPGWQVQMVA